MSENTALLQTLFRLMGKSVTVRLKDGATETGIVSGIQLDSVELQCAAEIKKLNLSNMQAVNEQETPPSMTGINNPPLNELESAVIEGQKNKIEMILKVPKTVQKLGFSTQLAQEIWQRATVPSVTWGNNAFRRMQRYQHILKGHTRPEVLEPLCLAAFKDGTVKEKQRVFAFNALLNSLLSRKQYDAVLLLCRENEAFITPDMADVLKCKGEALAFTEGPQALDRFLEENPQLYSKTLTPYWEKLKESFIKEQTPKIKTIPEQEALPPASNPFESAVIEDNRAEISKWCVEPERLCAIGYSEAEVEQILRAANNLSPGTGNAAIGMRLYILQRNRGNLAEYYLKKACVSSKDAARCLFVILCKEERYNEALELYEKCKAAFKNRAQFIPGYMDALYHTGRQDKFLEVFFAQSETPTRHIANCVILLAARNDMRLAYILPVLEHRICESGNTAVLSAPIQALAAATKYGEAAGILCRCFAKFAKLGNEDGYRAIAATGNLKEPEKLCIIRAAAEQNLELLLPLYWIANGTPYTDTALRENWYAQNVPAILAGERADWEHFKIIEELYPEKKTGILPLKFTHLMEKNDPAMAVHILQEAYAADTESVYPLLESLSKTPGIADAAVLSWFKSVYTNESFGEKITGAIIDAICALQDNKPVLDALYKFLSENTEPEYYRTLPEEKASVFKAGYFAYAGAAATETAQCALYDYLYACSDPDADLLCYFMCKNRRLWKNYDSSVAFEQLCESRNSDISGGTLYAAFEKHLKASDPTHLQHFLSKWNPFVHKTESDVERALRRSENRTRDAGQLILSAIAQYQSQLVWTALLEMYKNAEPATVGNILYGCAVSEHDPAEIRRCVNYAWKNNLHSLYVHIRSYDMTLHMENERYVKSVSQDYMNLSTTGRADGLPEHAVMRCFVCAEQTLSRCSSNAAQELLMSVGALALDTGFIRVYVEIFQTHLAKNPQPLLGLVLQLCMNHPEETAAISKLRTLLQQKTPTDFYGRRFVLDAADNAEKLHSDPVWRFAASMFLPLGSRINVAKMESFIYNEITASDTGFPGMERGMRAAGLLLSYFPEEALLHESLYFLGCADSAEKRMEETDVSMLCTCLFRYLAGTEQIPELRVHYTKRLYCGLKYMQLTGTQLPSGVPQNESELLSFFDTINRSGDCENELRDFIRLSEVLCHEVQQHPALLFGGFTGNWRPFIKQADLSACDAENTSDIAQFIDGLGPFNLLRSITHLMLSGNDWSGVKELLTEDEKMQVLAVSVIQCSDELKNKLCRWLCCTILDKSGALMMAENILYQTTPEEFGNILPVLRMLINDRELMLKLSGASPEYAECAAKTVAETCNKVPDQIYNKGYRDFLRTFSNMLFDRGLYKAAYPILMLIFETDIPAYQKAPDRNRVNDKTHAVYRQKAKFAGLTFGKEDEVRRLTANNQYYKIVNMFSVVLAMTRAEDLSLISHYMTPELKKLCAAVFFASIERFGEFEQLALRLMQENREMAEVLFWYGYEKFRDYDEKQKCYQCIENKTVKPPFFIIIAPHAATYRLNIFKVLDLENSLSGKEPVVKKTADFDEQQFLDMEFVHFVLESDEPELGVLSFADAITRFNRKKSVQWGAAVLRAYDFAAAEKDEKAKFFTELAIAVYLQQKKDYEFGKWTDIEPNVVRCLELKPSLSRETALQAIEALHSIIPSQKSLSGITALFREPSNLLEALEAAADAAGYGVIKLYLDTVTKLAEISPLLDEEGKLVKIGQIKAETESRATHFTADGEKQILAYLLFIIGKEERRYKNTALLKLDVDQTEIREGEAVTGYVYNFGLKPAKDITLTVQFGDKTVLRTQIGCIYAQKYAPFAFKLKNAVSGDRISCTIRITYSDEENVKIKDFGTQSFSVLPPAAFALHALSTTAIEVQDIDKEFVGREKHIQDFEHELYDVYQTESDELKRCVRATRQVPSMILRGPKRVGKSSMLHRVEKILLEDIPKDWTCVYADASSCQNLRDLFVERFVNAWDADKYKKYRPGESVVTSDAYKALSAQLPADKDKISMPKLERFYRGFRDSFAPGRKIMYIIDEIEYAINFCDHPQDLFGMLQYITKNMTDVISFIICGSDDLTTIMFEMENDTQLFQLIKPFDITRMEAEEYKTLLDSIAQQTGLCTDEMVRQELWRLTNGQVFYTKSIYNNIVSRFKKHTGAGSRKNVYLYDIYEALEALYDGNSTFFGIEAPFVKNGIYTDEGEVLRFLQQKATQPDMAVSYIRIQSLSERVDVDRCLKRLCARTFVTGDQEYGYKFTSEIYRLIFRNNSPGELYFREWEEAK